MRNWRSNPYDPTRGPQRELTGSPCATMSPLVSDMLVKISRPAAQSSDNGFMIGLGVRSAEMEQAAIDNPTPWDTVDPLIEVAPAPEAREVRPETRNPTPETRTYGGAFTIPLICMGIGLIALCLLIPAADENRRLAYEHLRLQADLDQLKKQVETNDAFLHRISSDPTLAERLARRQMKMVPAGTAVLELKSQKNSSDMSPFLLVTVPPPAPMPPYRPIGGFIANAVRQPKSQLYLIGAGMMLIAIGVVIGRSTPASAASDELDEQPVLPHNPLPNVS